MEVNNIQISESLNLKIGDVLKLENKLKVFFTNLEDKSLAYQKYLALPNTKRFQYVNLYQGGLGQAGQKAFPLFASTESSIKRIESYPSSEKKFALVITELFEIQIFNAIRYKEVSLKEDNTVNEIHHNIEKKLIDHIGEIENNFLLGFLPIKERENQKEDAIALAFSRMLFANKWDI